MDSMAEEIRRAREAGQVCCTTSTMTSGKFRCGPPPPGPCTRCCPVYGPWTSTSSMRTSKLATGLIVPTQYLANELRCRFPNVLGLFLPPGIDPARMMPLISMNRRSVIRPEIYKPNGSHRVDGSHQSSPSASQIHAGGARLPARSRRRVHPAGLDPSDRSEILLAEVPCRVHQMPWGGVDRLPASWRSSTWGSFPGRRTVPSGPVDHLGLQYAAAGVPFIATGRRNTGS